MYAYQIIDSLNETLSNKETLPEFIDRFSGLPENIQKSHKFYMGNIHNIHNTFLKYNDDTFIKLTQEFARLPYDLCYFDYINPPIKGGVLVQRLEENLVGVFYFVSTGDKNWMLLPLKSFWSLSGTPLKQYDLFKHPDYNFDNQTSVYAPILKSMEMKGRHADDMIEDCAKLDCFLAYSLILLNCKNIITERIDPAPALNKKRRKRRKQELYSYHILKIKPTGGSKKGESFPTGDHNRVHLCRGHFKLYTTAAPLFGRYTGLYWWQPHVRGQNKKGIVLKDYEFAENN